MGKFLVIGGTGVMGTAAIQAVRKVYGKDAKIIANWYGKEIPGFQIDDVDHTIFGDITDQKCLDSIKAIDSEKFDFMFYATALGDVGTPICDATQEQIDKSNTLSYLPILDLEEKLELDAIVAYSTFYVIRHQLATYGAMGHSKEAIEKWTVAPGKSRHSCIRAGLFESTSSRGIKLLLRKAAKHPENLKDPLLRGYFENVSSREGIIKFEEGIFQEEKETYGDARTRQENLYDAHLELFQSKNPVFVNVCGKKIWHTEDPLLLKDYF